MVRFVIGDYGAGKTFFLHLVALASRWRRSSSPLHADLTPDRRLHATGGQARAPVRRADAQPRHPLKPGRRRAARASSSGSSPPR